MTNKMKRIVKEKDRIKKEYDGLDLITREFKEKCKVKEYDSK
jgi:hypothetical protein